MAETGNSIRVKGPKVDPIHLHSFEIQGLFGYLDHGIKFPRIDPENRRPELCILEGQNGTGKTTIMQIIASALTDLTFDKLREVPFNYVAINFSDGDTLGIEHREDPNFPLQVTFGEHSVSLYKSRDNPNYDRQQRLAIDEFRQFAMPKLETINFELLTIERTLDLLRQREEPKLQYGQAFRTRKERKPLAFRVKEFLKDAQVDYRRFFQTSQFDLFPHIFNRFANPQTEVTISEIRSRTERLLEENEKVERFGLQTDLHEIRALQSVLNDTRLEEDTHAFSLVESYVEIHENRQRSRELILSRINQFERLMDDFLVGKIVRVSTDYGLEIRSETGILSEYDLSSGEYHFLYMMVSALLCQREGTVLAIDEPELSLHVSWQRRLVAALSHCASGASPMFFFSTHSTAISAEHSYAVQTLSPIE
ncbi:ATP-binding protein [Qipengyuania sp. GH25]|uniref:ATP-binding protein n=1 Tax=Qipengyuania pacifica TaxID=2860199 RepID=A0ABS7JH63_9SPHN|nr:AAA family ATPase [Qipengyuania aerophila]MBX7488094.1 ATP-binding protein [Qipengyuania aerophila]